MHHSTTIRAVAILRDQYRPGFGEPFDMVVFTIAQDGIDDLGITIWVHPSYPADRTEAVARALLVARLTDMTIAAAHDALSPADIDRLWQTAESATLARRSS